MPVKRDPDTGQFVSVEDGDFLDYTDYRFTTFSVEVEQAGDSNSTGFLEFEIDGEPDLDNDELANVVDLDLGLTVRNDPDSGTANTSPGSIEVIAEFGVNVDGDNFVTQGGEIDVQTRDVGGNASGSTSIIGDQTAAVDDPGHLGILAATADATYQDSGSSTGGGGAIGQDRLHRNFGHRLGEGPWLGPTDQFEGTIDISKNTTDSDARGTLVGQVAYLVVEDEEQRPRFGFR